MQFTDQMGRVITLEKTPVRIVSLVPSQTELLFDLGLENEVVGITKFCIHPDEWFRKKTRVGGTKQIDFEKIKSLQPDLIIGNKEENDQEQIELLMQDYHVWMSDIKTLPDALEMIRMIGELTGRKEKSEAIAAIISNEFSDLKSKISNHPARSVAYFIWKNPWMVAGKDTFIDHLLSICNLKNVFSNSTERYSEITIADLKEVNPEIIFLSSEPYPFKEKHISEIKEICPDSKILLVDGELFSWYGSRLLKSPAYLQSIDAAIQ